MNPPLSSRCRWLSSIVRTSPAVGRKSCQRARRLARTGQRLRARQHTPAALADALRQELAPWRVKVVVIEPASINSSAAGNVTRNAAMAAAPRGRILYDDAFGKMLAVVMQRREDADSPPDVAAATITRALTAAPPATCTSPASTPGGWPCSPAAQPLLDAACRRVFGLPAPGSLAS